MESLANTITTIYTGYGDKQSISWGFVIRFKSSTSWAAAIQATTWPS